MLKSVFITGLIFAAVSATSGQAAKLPFRVVIDPGHGGEDLGTVHQEGSHRISEKEITLLLAREAAKQLRARGYMVFLTRDTDREVPLATRTALANRLGADVFLSIHMNSTPETGHRDADGIETYIFNNTTDASSHRLAKLENTILTAQQGDEGAQSTDVALILKEMRLDANLAESKRLACSVQQHMVSAAGREKDRGVKQALFHVLLGADMPSILVEAGFLSSSRDRDFVLSSDGRRRIGSAIAQSIEDFRKTKNTRSALALLSRCKVH